MIDLIIALSIYCNDFDRCSITENEGTVEWVVCHDDVRGKELNLVLADMSGRAGMYMNIYFKCD